MARLQLALNVRDIDEAVDFYSTVFDTTPHKRRDGYANFEVADPPLQLVLFEHADAAGSVNHLGVEVETTDEVTEAMARVDTAGVPKQVEEANVCCHAAQDKVNFHDPSGTHWEIYTIVDDDPDGVGLGTCGTDGQPAHSDENDVCCS